MKKILLCAVIVLLFATASTAENFTSTEAVFSSGDKITISDTTISTQESPAVVLEGGSVNLTDCVLLAGEAEAAVWFHGEKAGTFSMTRGSAEFTEDEAFFRAEGTAADIVLSEAVLNNAGCFLFAEDGAKVTLKAANQNITGDIEIDGDSTLDMTLSGDSAFTGAVPDSGGTVTLTLDMGAKWTLTDDSYISSLAGKGAIGLNGYKLYVSGQEYDDSNSSEESGTHPTITTTELNEATAGKSYSVTLTAEGTKPITWTANTDALPEGMSFTSHGKPLLSGRPAEAGSYSLEFTATNNAGSDTVILELKVNDQKPKIHGSMKTGAIDEEYLAEFTLSAGTGDIEWTITGELPEGLEFDSDSETATISGTPTEAWDGRVTITASNETGGTDSKTYTLKIKTEKPKIGITSLPAVMAGDEVSAALEITGTKPITVTVTDAPDGFAYDAESDMLTGTPAVAGKYSIKVTAENAAGKTTKTLKLTVNSAPVIGDVSLADGTTGKNYTHSFTATGTTPITWSSDGELPEGITISSKGKLKGTPTGAGTYAFTVTAENEYGSDEKEVSLTIKPVKPEITTKSLKKGTAGKAYSAELKVKGSQPITWDIQGELPDGITFEDGVFSGTCESAFSGSVTVTAANDGGTSAKTYTLTIEAVAPKITTKNLPSGTYGVDYSAALTATGTPDIVWSWERSKAPAGLAIDSETGKISGTPIAPGTYSVNVSAANDAKTVSKTFKIVIAEASRVSSAGNAWAKPGQNVPELVAVSGLTLPDGYEIVYELGEVSVDVSGMYDIKLKLDGVNAGAKLFWLARPQNAEPSDDDAIAEFYEEGGEETDSLPASRRVTVSAWLNAGVKYSPAIAAKKQ